jgi:hypothetical protein
MNAVGPLVLLRHSISGGVTMAASASVSLRRENEQLAWLGVWLAIGGIVLPALILLLVAIFSDRNVIAPCGLLFAAMEVAALGCGIATRRQQPGKAALAISIISLVIVGLVVGLFMPTTVQRSGPEAEIEGASAQ